MILVIPLVWGLWLAIYFNLPRFFVLIVNNLRLNGEVIGRIIASPWTLDTESLLFAEWVMAPAYFFASYYLEYWFSRKKLKDFNQVQVKKAFFYANLSSYLMIMLFETIYQSLFY